MKIIKLNNDSSWWIEMGDYTFIIDPWFTPSQIDIAPWFSEQFHLDQQPSLDKIPTFDFIFISHPFNDHCNKETLLQFNANTPIYGPKKVIQKIKKWNYFKHIDTIENAPIQITQFKATKPLDLVHNGYLFQSSAKSLFYAPHGAKLSKEINHVDCLITTSTLYELPFWLGGTVNLGWSAAEKLAQQTNAKHIISTHDEAKIGKGLVEKVAKKFYCTKEEALNMKFLIPFEAFHIS